MPPIIYIALHLIEKCFRLHTIEQEPFLRGPPTKRLEVLRTNTSKSQISFVGISIVYISVALTRFTQPITGLFIRAGLKLHFQT
jgi:hypothetical protein